MFAFARDNGLPFARFISYVSVRNLRVYVHALM